MWKRFIRNCHLDKGIWRLPVLGHVEDQKHFGRYFCDQVFGAISVGRPLHIRVHVVAFESLPHDLIAVLPSLNAHAAAAAIKNGLQSSDFTRRR